MSDYKDYNGNTHNSYGAQQAANQAIISSPSQSRTDAQVKHIANQSRLYKRFNEMIDAYNAKNWDGVIDVDILISADSTFRVFGQALPYSHADKALLMLGIALANKNNDYQAAFDAARKGNTADDHATLVPVAIRAGKEAWERVNGREMTGLVFPHEIIPSFTSFSDNFN